MRLLHVYNKRRRRRIIDLWRMIAEFLGGIEAAVMWSELQGMDRHARLKWTFSSAACGSRFLDQQHVLLSNSAQRTGRSRRLDWSRQHGAELKSPLHHSLTIAWRYKYRAQTFHMPGWSVAVAHHAWLCRPTLDWSVVFITLDHRSPLNESTWTFASCASFTSKTRDTMHLPIGLYRHDQCWR